MDMATLNNVNNGSAGVAATAATAQASEVSKTTDAAVAVEVRRNESMAEPEREQVLAAVADMQDYVDATGRNIQFQLDDDSGRMVVTVTERGSGDVIRQMPSEEALRLAENLAEMRGVLFSGEV